MARHRPGRFSWRLVFRGLIRRLSPVAREPVPGPEDLIDPWFADRSPSTPTPLTEAIDEIERSALSVYAQYGLPTRPGHYARAPGDHAWQFVAEHLTPEQRWGFLEDYPPQQGWTFTNLAGLGHHARLGDAVMEASRLMRECVRFREMPAARADLDSLEKAIRLGVAWSRLTSETVSTEVARLETARPGRIVWKPPD